MSKHLQGGPVTHPAPFIRRGAPYWMSGSGVGFPGSQQRSCMLLLQQGGKWFPLSIRAHKAERRGKGGATHFCNPLGWLPTSPPLQHCSHFNSAEAKGGRESSSCSTAEPVFLQASVMDACPTSKSLLKEIWSTCVGCLPGERDL